jgi:hypothetical protein
MCLLIRKRILDSAAWCVDKTLIRVLGWFAGATSSKFVQRTSVRISQARTWPSHVSGRRPMVCADYR